MIKNNVRANLGGGGRPSNQPKGSSKNHHLGHQRLILADYVKTQLKCSNTLLCFPSESCSDNEMRHYKGRSCREALNKDIETDLGEIFENLC